MQQCEAHHLLACMLAAGIQRVILWSWLHFIQVMANTAAHVPHLYRGYWGMGTMRPSWPPSRSSRSIM